MGCSYSQQGQKEDNSGQEFITLVRRLQVSFRQESTQLSAKITQCKQQLKLELAKSLQNRSRIKQQEQLSQLALHSHFKMIYQYLSLQCRYILDRQRFIPMLLISTTNSRLTVNQKVSLLQPIQVILFSISIVNDGRNSAKNGDLANFQNITLNKFKDIDVPTSVQHNLLAYYKYSGGASKEMIREIVFQFCQQVNTSISKFQENGHNFKY